MKSTSVRKPYTGGKRALVIALDVGTTFSGVSYAILEPGDVPKIHGVTRFPGQEHVAGNSKIPSIMWYSKSGRMKRAGAEAESSSNVARAEDEGWTKAELFKLRLRPRTMKIKMNGMKLAPLPNGKTPVEVFGDFLAYLFQCTRTFIEDTHANGPALWKAVERNINFVLSHPNGWEGAQQTKMRRAAIYARLIPDTDEGKSRIRFVTEGEASLHACVLNGLAADVLSNPSDRHGFLVLDAGGGTLDISSYAVRGTAPLVIEEIAPPDCIFAGAVFVSRRARTFLEVKLRSSRYGSPDSLDHITRRFDETTKRLFRDKKESQFVPFGSPLDKDLAVGIRGGQLKLAGPEVAELFEPSINAAVASIRAQIDASGGAIKSVWLVGGFASSPWLFHQLQERLAPLGLTVSRPDSQTSKAVADGAVGFYCDHHVSARMSKYMYGVEFLREVDPTDPEHIARQGKLCELPSGPKLLPDAFDCILARGVKVKESTVFSRKYCTEISHLASLSMFEVEIWCYRGGDIVPKWILRDSEQFSTLCVVQADLSQLRNSAQREIGPNGKEYWRIVFRIEIQFGLTEFHARIKWVQNGKVEYGPATIVYNESGTRAGDDDGDDSGPDDESVVDMSRAQSISGRISPDRFAPLADVALPRPEPPSSIMERQVSISTAAPPMSRSPSHSTSASYSNAPPRGARDRSISTTNRSITESRRSSVIGNTLKSVWGEPPPPSNRASPRPELEYVDYPPQQHYAPPPRSNGPGTPGPPPAEPLLFDAPPFATEPPMEFAVQEMPPIAEVPPAIEPEPPAPVFEPEPEPVAPESPVEPPAPPPPAPEPEPEPEPVTVGGKKKGKKSGKNTPKAPTVAATPAAPPAELAPIPEVSELPPPIEPEPEPESVVAPEPQEPEPTPQPEPEPEPVVEPATESSTLFSTEPAVEPSQTNGSSSLWSNIGFGLGGASTLSKISTGWGLGLNGLTSETPAVPAAEPQPEPEPEPAVAPVEPEPEPPVEDTGFSVGKKKKKGKGSALGSTAEPSSPWGASKPASPWGETAGNKSPWGQPAKSPPPWGQTPAAKSPVKEPELLPDVGTENVAAEPTTVFAATMDSLVLEEAPAAEPKDAWGAWGGDQDKPKEGGDSWGLEGGGSGDAGGAPPQPDNLDLGSTNDNNFDTWNPNPDEAQAQLTEPPASEQAAGEGNKETLDDLSKQLLDQLGEEEGARKNEEETKPEEEPVAEPVAAPAATNEEKDEDDGAGGKNKKKKKKRK